MARSAADIQAEIDLVDSAITDLLANKNQEISIAGRRVRRTDLSELRAHRAELRRELAAVSAPNGLKPAVIVFQGQD